MSGLKSDCQKFSPNVFNKTKCQNCFRTKDSHSAEALESNRASRNVSKCGYLFVAPDWDFNVSVNRTKRWQRRWFVLYDDGELTYSLDEFPDTIPQGTIDMNKVLDVSDAEGITGNEFAVAITTPDKVHFIKGTSKEESKWWFDVLCRVSPRYLSRMKHKRNATFPCGKATIPTPDVIKQEYSSKDDMRLNKFSRPKFLSTSEVARDWVPSSETAAEDEDVFSIKVDNEKDLRCVANREENHNASNKLNSLPEDIPVESESQIDQEASVEKTPKDYLAELEESENRRRNRRYLKRENRIQRNQRSRNDGVSKMIPQKNPAVESALQNTSAIAAAEKLEYLESIHKRDEKLPLIPKDINENKEILLDSVISKKKERVHNNLRKSESLKNIPAESADSPSSSLRRYHSFKGSSHHQRSKNGTSSLKRSKSTFVDPPKCASTPLPMHPPVSSMTSSSSLPPLPLDISQENTTEGTFTRTGWLLRQTHTKDWSRHWFVLKDSSLTYYRDPSAEHCGIMDGILDLNQVSSIREQESDKFYAISLKMWDGKKHVLAAETEEFRSIWIQALQYASNLWSSASKEDFICSEIVLPDHTFHHNDRLERLSPPSSLLSYADEAHQDSSPYTSDDQSEYFSLVDEDEVSDLSSSPRTLPPSPPINRNAISLVKEKSRIRGHGSKTNSPSSDSDMVSCLSDVHRSTSVSSNQNYSQDLKDNHCEILQEEDSNVSFNSDNLINGDDRCISPITPPIEFMNESQDIMKQLNIDNTKLTKRVSVKNSANALKQTTSSESKLKPTDECSLCSNMKAKLFSAQEEIKKLEKELKEAHASFDTLEMFSYKLTQDMKAQEENYKSQIALMTAKIDDLTSKFTTAEKNYRQLKQKATKNETKERRRSSLKSREGLSVTKEYETKLCELEKKIGFIESSVHMDHSEIDESEKSLTDNSFRLNDSLNTTSESSETSTPMESSGSESKNFFSRLQSLMSRVDNVNSLVSGKDSSENTAENPKILLQVRENEELCSLPEQDEWQPSLSSDTILNTESRSYPKNLQECQSMLSQKLNDHFQWLKQSLEIISEQATNDPEHGLEHLNLLRAITRELNELHQEQNSFHQPYLLMYELGTVLDKLNSIDNITTLLKSNATKCAFKAIFHTLCITFAEYENYDLSGILNIVSSIPQIDFFCPLVKVLLTGSDETASQSINLLERLQFLESQMENVLSSLSQAKLTRYDGLWNILTEVPVQDYPINKPIIADSVLNCTNSIATDIHRIAELQLCNVPNGAIYLLEVENERIQRWRENSVSCLKDSLASFLDELKQKCPMMQETEVSFHRLTNEMRNKIIHLVTELSFLNICHSLLKSLKTEYSQTESRQNDVSLYKEWFSRINKSNYFSSNNITEDIFQCPQCSILKNLVTESAGSIQWSDYVKKYNYYNVKKVIFGSDLSIGSSERSSVNVPNRNQKDVCNNVTCPQCDVWIQKFCNAEMQHETEHRNLELKHNAEVKQLEECIIKTSELHDQEMLQKQNELSAVTAQLQRLKIEYEDQKQMLKDLYEKKLNFDCEITNEDNIREMYRMEIEDLKDMFKEGLAAIENSHNRITAEMERRHDEEIALLEAEKQRALEIEAQATLTALEAMKKYHAQELSQTTASIKEDMKKIQHEVENETLYTKYRNELDKLKGEILRITELYSSKCLENVALEDKVNSLRQQLKEAQNELCSLLTRNKEKKLCKESRHF